MGYIRSFDFDFASTRTASQLLLDVFVRYRALYALALYFRQAQIKRVQQNVKERVQNLEKERQKIHRACSDGLD